MGNTVLVVNDRPDARYSMAHPLATAGFDVRETATGRDALRLARLQVDAVVLDLVLPDIGLLPGWAPTAARMWLMLQ